MRTHPVCINQFLFFLVAVSGEETQTARGENIELETITTVTVHFRIMTVSTTATTSIALRDKEEQIGRAHV